MLKEYRRVVQKSCPLLVWVVIISSDLSGNLCGSEQQNYSKKLLLVVARNGNSTSYFFVCVEVVVRCWSKVVMHVVNGGVERDSHS